MVNKVILVGNLGRDPEARYTQSGTPVTTLNLATTRKWKGRDGQLQEETEWHRIVAWQKLAELCAQYLHKGSKIYVEGRLQTRKYQAQDGSDRYTTEIVAETVKFLDPKGGAQAQGSTQSPGNAQSRSGARAQEQDPFASVPPDHGVPF